MTHDDFWQALNPGTPGPARPKEPVEALAALLRESADGDYFSVGFQIADDPWPRLALGLAPDYWQTQLASQVTRWVSTFERARKP